MRFRPEARADFYTGDSANDGLFAGGTEDNQFTGMLNVQFDF